VLIPLGILATLAVCYEVANQKRSLQGVVRRAQALMAQVSLQAKFKTLVSFYQARFA
jgi:hypothetical protein